MFLADIVNGFCDVFVVIMPVMLLIRVNGPLRCLTISLILDCTLSSTCEL
jgi:hypothetical protein